ncbi:hypothetical protein IEZ26_17035 [Nocardioides cavernae]|uniref:Peptidase M4 domain-containing protein n=1 Tax=Nocardioides cavernae TaxID=1921566 RepID=A0ABR8NDW9_9ACTN|nr:hypothetical protein [Nocardioides cavernae]MBD3926333.1 hypothetical protein [Nocardioides cavernae]MBM7513926.1 hypothetical protein [Nocardioides cavernae]
MADVVAEVDLLVQDGSLALAETGVPGGGAVKETKELRLSGDVNDRFLDGPACRRIAIVDFEPATGLPSSPPATFTPFTSNPRSGKYVADGDETSATNIAINAFGTVFQTVRMFEGRDALGRRVDWAFGSEQLLVVPRAGEWANAFYERATRSLQFFSFVGESGARVHTALSRDIVAHECGHALLDAVAPSLYDSSTPQSVAIHESVADLVAVIMALDSRRLREAVLARSDNVLAGANAFTAIAEEFGMARPGADGIARHALRELENDETLETLSGARPHILSTLLSAIFYDTLNVVFAKLFQEAKLPDANGVTPTPAAAANKALGTAQIVFRRFLLRGIDYLPPGELSFADVGRATLAADRAARPAASEVRENFSHQFVKRLVVATAQELESPQPQSLAVPPDQVSSLHDSDWAAYQYATRHRSTLGLPDGVSFTVLPRVDSTKVIGAKGDDGVAPIQRELIVKIAWNDTEDSTGTVGGMRVVPTGATVVLKWDTGECLALVRSDVTGVEHRRDRDRLLAQLEEDGALATHDGADVGESVGLRSDGDSGLRASHRLLHLAGWDG